MDTQNPEARTEAVDAKLFRGGMSKVVAAVHIVTVRQQDEVLGATATAVCSVSDAPPTLLVCLHRQGRVCNAIQKGSSLAVNALAEGHEDLADIFAGVGGVPMPERFAHGRWRLSMAGAPVLRDSVICFQTEVVDVIEAYSHHVILCRVLEVLEPGSAPALPVSALLYGARRYHTLRFS